MTLQYFLELGGVGGPSTVRGVEGAFNVSGFSFSGTNTVPGGGGGGGATAIPDFQPLRVQLADASGLASFLQLVAAQTHTAAASLVGLQAGDHGLAEAYRINLAEVVVTDVVVDEFGGFEVTLGYSEIGVVTQTQAADGSAGTPHTFAYDLIHHDTNPPPNAIAGAQVDGPQAPSHYFLLIDGVDGGSTDAHHAGWFELPSFLFDVKALTSSGSGGGGQTGGSAFTPLNVTLNTPAGLTTLLAKLAAGATLPGIRVEGVNDAGQTVYKLDLADVGVARVIDDGAFAYHLGFNFDRIQLVTTGQHLDGSLGTPQTFSWNLDTHSASIGTLPVLAPGNADDPRGPDTFFLEFSGLGGSSHVRGFEGAFQVATYFFGASNAADPVLGGGGADNAPAFDPLFVRLQDEAGLTDFLALVASGQHTAAASLIGASNEGGRLVEAYRINLANVVVTDVSEDSEGGFRVTLGYDEVGVTVQTQKPTGQTGTPQVFGYDLVHHDTNPPPAAVPGAAVDAAGVSHYFLLVDGVDGGSHDAHHEGWFEVPTGFVFDVTALASGGGGGGQQQGGAAFDPLITNITHLAGLTNLLARVAGGGTLPGVRLEGVNTGGQTVYRLDLADVHVTQVGGGSSDAFQARFDYGRIQLVTTGQDSTGQLGASQTFSWNLVTHSPLVGTLPTLNAGTADDPTAPTSFVLEVGGLGGPSQVHGFEGAFDVRSFDFAESNIAVTGGGGGGGATGHPVFAPLRMTLTDQAGLTDFLQLVSSAHRTAAVSLVGLRTGDHGLEEAYRINLANVLVTDVHETATGGFLVQLVYDEIGVTLQTERSDGSAGAPQTFGYDLVHGDSNPPPAAVPAAATDGAAGASHFFLLVDGVDGGSTDAHHAGWFDLASYDFDIQAMLAAGGGGGAQQVLTDFAPLSVGIANQAGLTELLAKLAGAGLLRGVRLEGVNDDGQVVYKLDLADVHVTRVGEGQNDGYQAGFDFDRIQLVTTGQHGDGSLGSTQTFSWNLTSNSANIGTLPPISPGGSPNHAPVAVADAASVAEDGSVNIDVLSNDTDPDVGDTRTLVSLSATAKGASVSIVAGHVVYVADADSFDPLVTGQTATDSFSYVMRDAAGATSTATVQVTVSGVANGPTQTGGTGNDSLTGTGLDEKLDGAAGNDTLDGGGGADSLTGGAGNDSLAGGAGIDLLSAGDGNDTLVGGAGDDILTGARGTDLFVFGAGFGHDVVTDFKSVEDDIRFVGSGFANFADMMIHTAQVGANVMITTASGDSVQLNNVLLSSLQSSDFLFA